MKKQPIEKEFILIVVGVAISFFIQDHLVSMLFRASIYLVLSYTMHLCFKFTGDLFLGQGLFFGIGAYAAMVGMVSGLGFSLAMSLGVGCVILAGLVCWPFLMRLWGNSYTVAGLCLFLFFENLVRIQRWLTGGSDGLYSSLRLPTRPVLALMLFLTGLVVYLGNYLWEHRWGLQARMLKEDMDVAQSLGINPSLARFRFYVFTVVIVGISGGLSSLCLGYINPGLVFSPGFTLIPLAVSILAWARGNRPWTFVLLIVGMQELINYLGLGLEALLVGIVLILLPFYLERYGGAHGGV